MSARLPFALLDVFTSTPLEGNGLAVVHDADGVDERTMLRFAKEMRLSETTFVQRSSERGADYRNRIWTIHREIPFAGHPSLGTAVAVARWRGERDVCYVQETGAGLQPIEVEVAGDHAHASMLQAPASFADEVDAGALMAALGLAARDADRDLAPQIVSTGLPVLIAPVAGEEAVARATPDFSALARVLPDGAHNVYVVDCSSGGEGARARMFSEFVEGGEDPATGSAAGPLCAYLSRYAGRRRVEITQGVEMGRPSRLLAEHGEDGVRVAGDVVCVVEGTVRLPAD